MTTLMAFLALQDAPILIRLCDGKDVSPKEIAELPRTSVARATAVIAFNVRTRAWMLEPEDVELLRRSHDKEFPVLLGDFLKMKRDGLRLSASRTLILAHLEDGREIPNVELKAKAVGLAKSERWVAAEGVVVARVRAKNHRPEEIEKLVPPGFEIPYFTASEILRAAFRETDLPDGLARAAKAFRTVSGPMKKSADEIRSTLERLKFCRNCQGTAGRPCDYEPCEGGKIVKCCATCNGTGKNPQSYHAPNFQTPCPNPGNNGRHKWVEDCSRCRGAGKMPCKNCKAPWRAPAPAEVYDASPCDFCSSTGWALERMQLPCPSCHGIGEIVRPPKVDSPRGGSLK